MSWATKVGGVDGSVVGGLATAARRASLPVAAAASNAVRRAAGVRTFRIDDRELPYFVAGYNETWRNERCVELAVAFDWLERRGTGSVLEIGHVLGHYRDRAPGHVVVDLYEPAPDVLNEDALTYDPGRTFRSIVAVSTLEHVGFDEDDQDPEKTRRLVDHLASLLDDDGELLITVPLGYNHALDQHLIAGRLGFDELAVMKRVTTLGEWTQADVADIPSFRYGFPFHRANAIAIGRRRASAPATT